MRQLIDQKQWDVRHGGLLGLKYLLAARADLGPQLLPEALPAALLGLKVGQCRNSRAEDITPAWADLALSSCVSRPHWLCSHHWSAHEVKVTNRVCIAAASMSAAMQSQAADC